MISYLIVPSTMQLATICRLVTSDYISINKTYMGVIYIINVSRLDLIRKRFEKTKLFNLKWFSNLVKSINQFAYIRVRNAQSFDIINYSSSSVQLVTF